MKLLKTSNRNARVLDMGDHRVGFSYETPVAYWGPEGNCRRKNHWGPTTGGHLKQMNAYHLEIVEDEQFFSILNWIVK